MIEWIEDPTIERTMESRNRDSRLETAAMKDKRETTARPGQATSPTNNASSATTTKQKRPIDARTKTCRTQSCSPNLRRIGKQAASKNVRRCGFLLSFRENGQQRATTTAGKCGIGVGSLEGRERGARERGKE